MKANKFFFLLAFFIFLMFSGSAFGQLPCPDGCQGTYPNCEPCGDPSVPFDGGASLLLASGLAVGAGKIYKNRKKKKTELE